VLTLHCHGDVDDLPIERLEAGVAVAPGAADGGVLIELHFRLRADLRRLRLPPLRQGRRTDGLWRHSCFEMFLRERGAAAYAELNLAPCGDWAAYRFSARREGMQPIASLAAPTIDTIATAGSFELRASVRLDDLWPGVPGPGARPLEVALAAVIEEHSGRLSYWALAHPDPQRPDFHHPGSFVHEIRY